MKPSLLLLLSFGITVALMAQLVITLLPTGEVRKYSNSDLHRHWDLSVGGIRMCFSDSGQVMGEFNMKGGEINGYRKIYNNGILVELGLYKDGLPIGTHYFWNDEGILKKVYYL